MDQNENLFYFSSDRPLPRRPEVQRPNLSRFAAIKLLLLFAAFISFLLSVGLFFLAENESQGIFVGLWVPSILSLGTLMLVGEDKR
jgi:hypothetical protein